MDKQIFEAEILDKLPTESTNLIAEQIELKKYKMQTRLELEKAKTNRDKVAGGQANRSNTRARPQQI